MHHGPCPPHQVPPHTAQYLLSSIAVYTAWGDTEKNRSSRSSHVSRVSYSRHGFQGLVRREKSNQ